MFRVVGLVAAWCFLLAGVALAQVRVVNPFRSDAITSPGGSACITGATFADIEFPAHSFSFFPLDQEVAGVSIAVNGITAGVWIVFRESAHFLVPEDFPLQPRRLEYPLTITSPLGSWTTTIKIMRAAPALVSDGYGNPAGIWNTDGTDLHQLNEPVQVNRSGSTWLMVWTSGLKAALHPLRLRDLLFPLEPWFQPDCWLWIGPHRLPAMLCEGGLPGLDYVGVYLPSDIPAGTYQLRVEAGRVISEPLPIELVG